MSAPEECILDVRDLSVRFGSNTVVDGVSFALRRGECIGLVGASGSGKSVSAMALMGLLDRSLSHVEGKAFLAEGSRVVDLFELDDDTFRSHRGKDLAMVFQEPMTALDPVYTVGEQVAASARLHLGLDKHAARAHVVALFKEVQLPDPDLLYDRYPHQLSGGQKQRVVIALALSAEPQVLLCDEPTTALDVLVQRDVLDLLKSVQRKRRMGMLFITHDLGVVREVADRVLVMHKGKVVEEASIEELFLAPKHPYTKGLIACRPDPSRHPVRLPTVEDMLAGDAGPIEQISWEDRRQRAEKLMAQEPLLRIDGLNKSFAGKKGLFSRSKGDTQVLHELSFSVYPGETLGIVGGSGSGKTTLGRSILRLIEPSSGHVQYRGRELTSLSADEMRRMRRELQIIFQDPYSSLNPRMTIGAAISEAMEVHGVGTSDGERRELTRDLLARVGLEADHAERYPHQFSGGQRQRIVIARALSLEPRLIICDESVAALDVSVQAQVLNLLNELKEEHGLTYLFISHDLSVVKYFCDRILVLEKGCQAELRLADALYEDPKAPYTRMLVDAIPGRKP